MPTSRTPSLLDATALAFSPGQNAHPSPPYSERFSSPSSPLSAVDFQAQFPPQTQQYYGPQKPYGYQPYPLFNGYTQAYEYELTSPPPCPAQFQGAVPWYPQQNGYNGYVDYRADQYEPFADQFTELQGVRNGCIPGQQNTWHHYGTEGYMNNNNNYNNNVPKKIAKKNKRKKMNKLKRDYARAEEQAEDTSTQTQSKSKTDAKKQKAEQQNEHKNKTRVKTAAVEPVTKVCSIIGG
ncbi:hypothetical protein ACET3X_002784 [Alternaria dauci]|uniref:Mating type protein n=1 Tax=Alternaria dauci TaxID=48095 RepID=A0ABR3UR30_9PLEO